MPLNHDLQGKAYPPQPFTVDPGRVKAFALAIGHLGEGVPPTFATAPELAAGLDNVLADPELGIDLARVLHGEQTYEWLQQIPVGRTVVAEATIESIRAKGGMEFLSLRTEIRDAAGELLVVGRTTLIVRGET